MNSDIDFQMVLNSCARDIFRKEADRDYISARANYFMGLQQQFLWSSQQTVEKYLKAILLFNGKTARWKKFPNVKGKNGKHYGHDLIALNEAVSKIEYLKYSLPKWAIETLRFLKDFGGGNRYLSISSYSHYETLKRLDELVWHIRKYCRAIPKNNTKFNLRDATINDIHSKSFPEKYSLIDGELERVLKNKSNSLARKALVKENIAFGEASDKLQETQISSITIPPQDRDWFSDEFRQILEDYIQP